MKQIPHTTMFHTEYCTSIKTLLTYMDKYHHVCEVPNGHITQIVPLSFIKDIGNLGISKAAPDKKVNSVMKGKQFVWIVCFEMPCLSWIPGNVKFKTTLREFKHTSDWQRWSKSKYLASVLQWSLHLSNILTNRYIFQARREVYHSSMW